VKALIGFARGIVKNALTVGQDDVLALSNNFEPSFAERTHGVLVVDTRGCAASDRDFDLPELCALNLRFGGRKIIADGIADVLDRLVLVFALRPTAGQARD